MRGFPPVTIRTEDRRLRSGPNLLPDPRSPSGSRSRSAMVSSSTTQDSMGKEWKMPIYQRSDRLLRFAACAARARFATHFSLDGNAIMDATAPTKPVRINRFLPYWAVLQADMRQTLHSWVYRAW